MTVDLNIGVEYYELVQPAGLGLMHTLELFSQHRAHQRAAAFLGCPFLSIRQSLPTSETISRILAIGMLSAGAGAARTEI
jgi:hypothetical protein